MEEYNLYNAINRCDPKVSGSVHALKDSVRAYHFVHGINTPQWCYFGNDSPIHYALKKGKIDAFVCMVSEMDTVMDTVFDEQDPTRRNPHPIDFDLPDKNNNTLLHFACKNIMNANEQLKVIEILIEHEANVNAKDRNLNPPISLLLKNKDLDQRIRVLELLISAGAELSYQNKNHNSALDIAWNRCAPKSVSNILNAELNRRRDILHSESLGASNTYDASFHTQRQNNSANLEHK
jgi:ankyrin repeat protein